MAVKKDCNSESKHSENVPKAATTAIASGKGTEFTNNLDENQEVQDNDNDVQDNSIVENVNDPDLTNGNIQKTKKQKQNQTPNVYERPPITPFIKKQKQFQPMNRWWLAPGTPWPVDTSHHLPIDQTYKSHLIAIR